MTSQIQSLLDSLSNELSERQFDAAQETIDELSEIYQKRREEESLQADQSRSLYLDSDTVSIAEAMELDALERVNGSTQFSRVMLLTVVNGIVELNEELSQETRLDESVNIAQKFINELSQAETDLNKRSSSAQTIINDSTVPPSARVSITSIEQRTIAVNEETTLALKIRNAGDTVADGVSIEFSTTAGLKVNPTEITIGSLPANKKIQKTARVSGVTSGSGSVEIEVESQNAGTDRASGIIRVSKNDVQTIKDYAEAGLVNIHGLREAIADWRTDTISDNLLEDVVGAWRTQRELD